ncbi:MAG: T9SS type A sorting domain-containing protein [Candidatus Kapabacteria bacterium]|nr:T9SS type A sorting domain-containing protein [Candidatus Kapabacteria bacterium]
MLYKGAQNLFISNNILNIETPFGVVAENIPSSYQYVADNSNQNGSIAIGTKKEINCNYSLKGDEISFVLGDYDKTLPVVIDPSTVHWAQYFGGAGDECVGKNIPFTMGTNFDNNTVIRGGVYRDSIINENTGYIILVGSTISNTLPPICSSCTPLGNYDGFICKYSYSGIPIWATRFGGYDDDYATDVSGDTLENYYVCGSTNSANFPASGPQGPLVSQYYYGTNTDAFIIKFDQNGNRVFATFWGGTGTDIAQGICVKGNTVAVIGSSNSQAFRNQLMPYYPQPIDTSKSSGLYSPPDAWVLCCSTDFNTMFFYTFIGGTTDDFGAGICLNSDASKVFAIGSTNSVDFPVNTLPPTQLNLGNNAVNYDAFVRVYTKTPAALLYSTYYGGSDNDYGYSIVSSPIPMLEPFLICGKTRSSDLGVSPNSDPFNQGLSSSLDGFLANFISMPAPLNYNMTYAVYLGGEGVDYASNLFVQSTPDNDGHNRVFVTGSTNSQYLGTKYAQIDKLNLTGIPGYTDAFLGEFDAVTGDKKMMTYYGGSQNDYGSGVCAYDDHFIYIGGVAQSGLFEATNTYAGNNDAFLAFFDERSCLPTYYGGTGDDIVQDMFIDNDGNIYMTGYSSSGSLPGLGLTSYQQYNYANYDAFVVKFNNIGHFIWGTFYGGANNGIYTYGTFGKAIAKVYNSTDPNSDVYITGWTSCITGIAGAQTGNYIYQNTRTGGFDAFVLKLSGDGTTRRWGTYLGSTNNDYGNSIVVLPDGLNDKVFVGGTAGLDDFPVTTTTAPYGQPYGGNNANDGFMARFNGDGSIIWCRFIGGEWDDQIRDMAYLEAKGTLGIVGCTSSDNFPTTVDAYQFTTTKNYGYYTGIFGEINQDGSINYATYYGSSNALSSDTLNAIATDYHTVVSNYSYAYCIGNTNEFHNNVNLTTTGIYQNIVFQPAPPQYDLSNGFVVSFEWGTGMGWIRNWGTYIGGSGNDYLNDIAVRHSDGILSIVGASKSDYLYWAGTPSTFPYSFGLTNSHNPTGNYSGFLIQLTGAGRSAGGFGSFFSPAIGNNFYGTSSQAVKMDPTIYDDYQPVIAGFTSSVITEINNEFHYPYQSTINGGREVYLLKANYRLGLLNKTNGQSDTTILNTTSAINDFSYSIYPNPSTNNLIIKSNLLNETNLQFSITDLSGAELMSCSEAAPKGDFVKNIDVSKLVAGVYFITVKSSTTVTSKNFIKY